MFLVIILAHAFFLEDSGMQLAKEIVEIYQATSTAIVIIAHAPADSGVEAECHELLAKAGIPILSDGMEAAKAVARLAWYQEKAERDIAGSEDIGEAVSMAEGLPESLSEHQSKRILESHGIPVTREALATS